MRTRVTIIGGGITGLSTAWELQKEGIDYAVFEGASYWGGKVLTDTVEIDGETFIIDAGPESFITRKPEVWQLAHELSLQNDLIAPEGEAQGMAVIHEGELHFVPMNPGAFVTTSLLSLGGKLRLMKEPFVAPRKDTKDETLASFARRRLGDEGAQRLIEPVLGGIYNADPERQSVMVTAPHMRDLEREHGGLVRGMIATMRQKSKSTEPKKPRFITFARGTRELIDEMIAQLTGDLYLNAQVSAITRTDTGYVIELADGSRHETDAVIITTLAHQAADLLSTTAPTAAAGLRNLKQSSIGTMSLIYREDDVADARPVRGLMIPRREGRAIDAVLWTSKRLPERVPAGYAMLKVFFGGAQPAMAAVDEETLLANVRRELAELINIHAEPILTRTYRWPNGYPLSEVGHLEKLSEIEASLPPGIWLAGSAYRGLGVPDCIRQGQQTAHAVTQYALQLNTTSGEPTTITS